MEVVPQRPELGERYGLFSFLKEGILLHDKKIAKKKMRKKVFFYSSIALQFLEVSLYF